MYILFLGTAGSVGTCVASDTGSFQPPSSFVSGLPAATTILFTAAKVNIVGGPVSGDSIVYFGSTAATSTY